MIRIGFTGVPGSGKTSTAREVASRCRAIEGLQRIELVSEYARRYISKHGSIDTIWEQYRVMMKQIEWEDSVPESGTDVLVTDSPVHLGFVYAAEYDRKHSKDVMVLNDIFKKLSKINYPEPRYDIIFHLPPKLKPIEDGIRPKIHFSETWREGADRKIRGVFDLFKPTHFHIVEETYMDSRVDFVIKKLNEYIKL